jgi:membrane bound O-acyltransferase family protein
MNTQVDGMKWWRGWTPLVIGPSAVLFFAPPAWPRWIVMWMLAFAIYFGCKWLTWRRTTVTGVPVWRHAAYLLAWPGLDAAGFLMSVAEAVPTNAEWLRALRNVVAGTIIFLGLARSLAPHSLYLAGWAGMIGLVLLLHFGIFHLLSCAWRAAGVEARPLMNRPIASISLAEFWGRRWNTAFRDLTHRFLFRPMTRRFGAREGIAVGFIFSGLVHDLVISCPAGGGYGGPTLFFVLQGAGMLVERTRLGHTLGLAHGARGWMFTMLVLVLPAPLLFHPPFVERIIIPFMRASGAL